jgi:hydrogenase expression/formation protein HypD
VATVIGSDLFKPLAFQYNIPFGVAGFEGEEILYALYGIVKAYGNGEVMNFYPQVVTAEGNKKAKALVEKYFIEADASWRGMGIIPMTGKVLREEYAEYDAGSLYLTEDNKKNKACCCDQILMGKMEPTQCPLFGKVCKPLTPQGACMVSEEGSCRSRFVHGD